VKGTGENSGAREKGAHENGSYARERARGRGWGGALSHPEVLSQA
jgi:hypothetical protein